MPYNGAGVFNALTPPQYPAVAGDTIRAGYFNAVINDILNGLTNAITRDGQSVPTANLPMGGRKHTGVADGAVATEYASYGQLQKVAIPLTQYGTLGNNGVTDDAATFQAAAASGARVIDARGLNCFIGSTVNIPAGQTWLLTGTTIVIAGTAFTAFAATNVDNWSLVGPFTVVGDAAANPGTGVSSKGIAISNCADWLVAFPTCRNIKGHGMYMVPGASTRARAKGGRVIAPILEGNEWGWTDTAGTGAEYCSVIDAHATANYDAGIQTAAGNTIWLGGHCTDNVLDGMRVGSGANHAHGSVTGMNINHNPQFNLVCTQVTNGIDFVGCHFYGLAAGTSQGAIWLDRSKGIRIRNGHLDCAVYNYKDGSSGLNIIENMYCPGAYGINRVIGGNNGHDQLLIRGLTGSGQYAANIAGCVEATGASLNQMGTSFAVATRDAGSTAVIASGVATTLTWPTDTFAALGRGNPFSILNTGTGEFTFTEPGWYTFEGNQLFSAATSINQAQSFLEMQLDTGAGYQSSEIYMPAPAFNGGSTMTCYHKARFYIPTAGNKMRLQATITGVGAITHGRATWRCWAELRRTDQ